MSDANYNTVSRDELVTLKFDVDRIESVPEFVEQINRFASNGGHFAIDKDGAAFIPSRSTIEFKYDGSYSGFNDLAHELGHALGVNQSKDMSEYGDARSYAKAIWLEEAESIYNEYTLKSEFDATGKNIDKNTSIDSYISGGGYNFIDVRSFK